MRLEASVVHSTPRRVRLRIPELRGDPARLESVAEAYRSTGAVLCVHANARTATVLLDGLDVALAGRPAWLEEQGGLRLTTAAAGAAAPTVELDGRVLPTVLTALAALQAVRGRLLPPAVTLLLEAYHSRTTGGRR